LGHSSHIQYRSNLRLKFEKTCLYIAFISYLWLATNQEKSTSSHAPNFTPTSLHDLRQKTLVQFDHYAYFSMFHPDFPIHVLIRLIWMSPGKQLDLKAEIYSAVRSSRSQFNVLTFQRRLWAENYNRSHLNARQHCVRTQHCRTRRRCVLKCCQQLNPLHVARSDFLSPKRSTYCSSVDTLATL
jgi:hypothetical protein